jgi:hypothetical protein
MELYLSSPIHKQELRLWYCFAGKKIEQLNAEDVDEIEKLGHE